MALNSIKIEIEPTIKPGVANLCLKALELFINQNPGLDIISQRLPDGSIMLKIVERGLSEPPKNVVPAVSGWVSVKDRLPDKEGQYLCWFGKNSFAKGAEIATYLEMWKAFGSLESLETYPNVTHWMPIEPPKEETEDDDKG